MNRLPDRTVRVNRNKECRETSVGSNPATCEYFLSLIASARENQGVEASFRTNGYVDAK